MLELNNVSFGYAGAQAVRGVSLSVAPGEHVALVGANGSGKSTLLRLANGSLTPASGAVDTDAFVAMAGQDPGAGVVSTLVRDDVAFGPRNQGLHGASLDARVEEALEAAGIAALGNRSVATLSGGQLQRVALAGALALKPRYLVLDEVTAQLDAASRKEVRACIAGALRSGVGVLEVTHRPEELLHADRIVVMEHGSVAWTGTPEAFFCSPEALAAACMETPLVRVLALYCSAGGSFGGSTVQGPSGRNIAQEACRLGVAGRMADALRAGRARGARKADNPQGLSLEGITVAYDVATAVSDANLEVAAGTLCVVAGASGSGKSTLARVAAGVLEPDVGKVRLNGARVRPAMVGLSMQNPQDQLFSNAVLEDVMFGPLNRGRSSHDARRCAERALEQLGVRPELWGRAPFALSGGEQRRVALAGVVALQPAAYVLDEPTAGLDAPARAQALELARSLANGGAAVMVVTHDVYEWLQVADDVALMREGHLQPKVPAAQVLERGWPGAVASDQPFELELLEALHG